MRVRWVLGGVMLGGVTALVCDAMAGRPLSVDDADPAEAGLVEVEVGAAYERGAGCTHWDMPLGVAYGLVPNVEIGMGFGGQMEEREEVVEGSGCDRADHEHGVGDLEVGAKWQFLRDGPMAVRHAIIPTVKFPTADDDRELGSGKTDYDLTWASSVNLSGMAGAHLNVGYTWVGGVARDIVHYGLAVDCAVTEAVQWVGEVYAEKERSGGAGTVVQCAVGVRWAAVEGLTLDAAAGAGLDGDAPDFSATVGLTWALGGEGN